MASEFGQAINNWITENNYRVIYSDDKTIVIKFMSANNKASMSDEEIQFEKFKLTKSVHQIAGINDVEADIGFRDIDNDIFTCITIKPTMTREEASCRYYDLMKLGAKMTNEQYKEFIDLKKKFGFN
ncbi:MAG: hypothetical protein QXU32_02085 [Nitrososphaerales archaeon]